MQWRIQISLASLERENFVVSSRQFSPAYFDFLLSVCREYGFSPWVLHEVRSVTSQVAYVSCGQGSSTSANVAKLAPDNVVVKPIADEPFFIYIECGISRIKCLIRQIQ